MTGRAARTHNRYDGTSSMAADSGPAIAMFFGTISPRSTCSTTTIVIAMTNDAVCRTVSGMPSKWNGLSNRCATAGSPTRPNRIAQTVMQSCAPASITGRFSTDRMTVTALCLPCSARASSRSRRAEINANSAPTKKPLAASNATVRITPRKSPISALALHAEEVTHQCPRSSRRGSHPSVPSLFALALIGAVSFAAATAKLRQFQLIDPATVHPQHAGQPAHRVLQRCVGIECRQLNRLALFGDLAQLLQHQPADGLVIAYRRAETGGLCHLVDAQQSRHLPAASGGDDVRRLVVVFVADVADDLLDDVLDGHHARGAAVFVDHQRGLQAVGTQLSHHVVAVQGRRHPGDGLHQAGQPGLLMLLRWYFEDLFDVHDSQGLVEVTLDDRESRVTALDCRLHQICHGVVDLESHDFCSGCHQLLGRARAELQRPVHQLRGDGIQRPPASRVAHQRSELLR